MNANTLALDIVSRSSRITREELEAELDGKVLAAVIGPTIATLIRRGHLVERDDGVLEVGDEEAIEAAAREREERKATPPAPVAKSHRDDPSLRHYPPQTAEGFAKLSVQAKVLYVLGHQGPMRPADLARACKASSENAAYTALTHLRAAGKIRKVGKLYELATPATQAAPPLPEQGGPIVDVQAACAEAEEQSRPEPAPITPLPPKREPVRTIAEVAQRYLGQTANATVGSVAVTVHADSREQAARMLAAALGAM